jgi:DNA-directed RNA polymerase specialized sigma24 family protein
MAQAGEPGSEELFEQMRSDDREAAVQAFHRFLKTRGKWWDGDLPLNWARSVAEKHLAELERQKWPVHKLASPSAVANDALMVLARDAPKIASPPAFLRVVIRKSIEYEIIGHGRKGEPWGFEEDRVVDWKASPRRDSESQRLWQDNLFCFRVATRINSLSDKLRPFAILNLLDGLRPVDIAQKLGVSAADARQYVGRALRAIVGRRDGSRLTDLESTRSIRRALELPDGQVIAELDEERRRKRAEDELRASRKRASVIARRGSGGLPRKA